jgi:uncharacterized phage protein (TIGR01671 family)
MRERAIKFKLWLIEKKEFFIVYNLSFSDEGPEPFSYEAAQIRLDGEWRWVERDEFHLVEFTGLKDKNGREAYHKDMCKDEHNQMWTMEWMDVAAFVLLLDGADIDDADEDQILDASAVEQMEIIGNVHDNPELLESPTEHKTAK